MCRAGSSPGRLGEHQFRLHGSTDAGTDGCAQRILDSIAGQRASTWPRIGPDVLAGVLPLLYREVLDEA